MQTKGLRAEKKKVQCQGHPKKPLDILVRMGQDKENRPREKGSQRKGGLTKAKLETGESPKYKASGRYRGRGRASWLVSYMQESVPYSPPQRNALSESPPIEADGSPRSAFVEK